MKTQQRTFGMRLLWFLGFQCVLATLAILAIVFLLPDLVVAAAADRNNPMSESTAAMIFVVSAFGFLLLIICIVGIFRWRLWGYWGLMLIYTLLIIVSTAFGAIEFIIPFISMLAFTFISLNGKTGLMEMKL